MKKIAKMSLVAAMAISSLTVASAADLTEAIKGVKISGSLQYTMEKTSNDSYADTSSEAQHDIDIALKAVIPVNDMITATVAISETQDDDNDAAVDADNLGGLKVDNLYFTYSNDKLTSNFGLISAPLTDGIRADGVDVSYDFGVLTAKAGYLYSTELGSDEVAFVGIDGSAGPVSYYATYATVLDADTSNNVNGTASINDADALSLGLSGNIKMVSLSADYASRGGFDSTNTLDTQTQYKIAASADLGVVSVGLSFAKNGKHGGKTQLDGTDTGITTIDIADLELHAASGKSSAIQFDISGNINEKNKLAFSYADLNEKAANADKDAYKITYTYMMSKNFALSANYESTDLESASDDFSELTLGAKYTF